MNDFVIIGITLAFSPSPPVSPGSAGSSTKTATTPTRHGKRHHHLIACGCLAYLVIAVLWPEKF